MPIQCADCKYQAVAYPKKMPLPGVNDIEENLIMNIHEMTFKHHRSE